MPYPMQFRPLGERVRQQVPYRQVCVAMVNGVFLHTRPHSLNKANNLWHCPHMKLKHSILMAERQRLTTQQNNNNNSNNSKTT